MHELAKGLQARGHEVSVRTMGLPILSGSGKIEDPRDAYELDGVPVRRTPFDPALRRSVIWHTAGALLLRRHHTVRFGEIMSAKMPDAKADLAHVFMVMWQDTYASFGLARRLGLPVVFTPHFHPGFLDWVRKYCRPLLHQADAIIALTEFERQAYIKEGVPAEKIYCTGIGPAITPQFSAEKFRAKHNIKGRMVLFLARMSFYKNYRAVARAAPLVWREFPDTTFVFIGPGEWSSRPFFKRQKDPRILNLDKVPVQEKSDALAACDLLCVPSAMESFGGVYCEAWAMGKPVIGGDIPAVRELLQASQGGFAVKIKAMLARPKDVAARIIELLKDDALRTKMGENGRALVQRKFTWEALAAQTEKVYQDVLKRRS